MHVLFLNVKLLEYSKFITRRRVGYITRPYSLHPSLMHPAVKGLFASVEATDSTSSLPYPSVLLQFLSSSPW